LIVRGFLFLFYGTRTNADLHECFFVFIGQCHYECNATIFGFAGGLRQSLIASPPERAPAVRNDSDGLLPVRRARSAVELLAMTATGVTKLGFVRLYI
jgi:hypothetical protein